MSRRMRRLVIALLCAILIAPTGGMTASADGDELDPVRNVPLACELLSTPGLAPRSAKNIAHLANVCGFVGTDVEFQSRTAASGATRDYAFLGTMGFGLRIFDITDPAHPTAAGRYTDPGWQGDVQVRGDVAVVAFDPISGRAPTLSLCLPTASSRAREGSRSSSRSRTSASPATRTRSESSSATATAPRACSSRGTSR